MGTPRLVVISLPDNRRYVLLRGDIRTWLQDSDIPAVYSATRHGWFLRTERAGDVLALAESQGFAIHLRDSL